MTVRSLLLGFALLLLGASASHGQYFLRHTVYNPSLDVISFGARLGWVGDTLAIAHTRMFVGGFDSGRVYFCDPETGTILHHIDDPAPFVINNFGISVTELPGLIAIGSLRNDGAALNGGAVHLFDSETRTLVRTLYSPRPTANGFFGHQTARHEDYILIGAPGDRIADVVSSATGGAVYLMDPETGNVVADFHAPAPAGGDSFGLWLGVENGLLAATAQGSDLGATNAGAVFLYDVAAESLVHTLVNPDPDMGDAMGGSVSMAGGKVAVGALLDDTEGADAGAVYLFDAATGAFDRAVYSPSPVPSARFGIVSQADGRLAVGAPGSLTENVAGAVYVFDASGETLIDVLEGGSGDAADGYGNPLLLAPEALYVSAPAEDYLGEESSGVVRIYVPQREPSAFVESWDRYD